ncbi:MAG: hypothetical protein IPF99_12185 [Deltaproteobacteria bacterium]|nr:hypothetical protein [Deltaproteobacteria bacterium]
MSRSSQIVALSLRERTEIDAVFSRVRRGGHYEVLSLAPDADEQAIVQESTRLRQWLEGLLDPERLLGEYQPKVEAIAAAVQTAERVLRNPRERMRYDDSRPRASDPSQRSVDAAAAKAAAGARPRPRTPPPRPGPESQVRFLLAVLDAQLSVALGRPAGLLDRVAEVDVINEVGRALIEAENAEREERWVDAVVWWHLAGLTQPRDAKILLKAASALRRAGAVTAYGPYARVATGDPWFDRGES